MQNKLAAPNAIVAIKLSGFDNEKKKDIKQVNAPITAIINGIIFFLFILTYLRNF